MKLILTGEFLNRNETVHEVRIYDREQLTSVDPMGLVLEAPGYVIDWDAGLGDVLVGGVYSSKCDLFLRNLNGDLDWFLFALQTAKESRYLVEIYRNDSVWWRGVVISDFVTEQDQKRGSVVVSATDGLNLLSAIDVEDVDPGNRNSLLQYIIYGLNLIPTSELVSLNDSFLMCKTDWYCNYMQTGREPLDLVSANDAAGKFLWERRGSRIGFNGQLVWEVSRMTVLEQINHIVTRFNAILMQCAGIWYLVQRDLLADNNTIEYRGFKKLWSWTHTWNTPPALSTYKNITPAEARYRGSGMFENKPPLKSVKVTYLAESETNSPSSILSTGLLPLGYTWGSSYTTYTLYSGPMNYLFIYLTGHQLFTFSSAFLAQNFKVIVTWQLTVRIGVYYLQADGKTWGTTPATVVIEAFSALENNTTSQITNAGAMMHGLFYTDDIPVDGSVTIQLSPPIFTSVPPVGSTVPTLIPTGGITLAQSTIGKTWLFFVENNQQPSGHVTFISKNTNTENSKEFVLQDSLFGSSGQASKGLMHIWNGTQWTLSYGGYRKWEKGENTPKSKYLNELLVDEILAMQVKPLLCFNGTVYDRNQPGNFLLPISAIQFTRTYRNAPTNATYTFRFHPNRVVYDPQTEEWTGDWIQITRQKVSGAIIADEPFPFEDVFEKDVSRRAQTVKNSYDENTGKIMRYVNANTGAINTRGEQVTARNLRVLLSPSDDIPAPGEGMASLAISDSNVLYFKTANGEVIEVGGGSAFFVGTGARYTGEDPGMLNEMSKDDDYFYFCIHPGVAGEAVWRRIAWATNY